MKSRTLPSKFYVEYVSYTANVLAVKSTFYFCVKNPPTVQCDLSRYLSVVYQDQYSALLQKNRCKTLISICFIPTDGLYNNCW